MVDDPVAYRSGRDDTGPAHGCRDSPAAFPVSIFLTAKRSRCCIGPCVIMRSIVGTVEYYGVFCNPEFIEQARDKFDRVIIDTPPVLAAADAGAASAAADGVGARRSATKSEIV